MDLTVLELAVPAISRALRPTGAELLWIVDIHRFFVAGLPIREQERSSVEEAA